jgi:hypothetical protein
MFIALWIFLVFAISLLVMTLILFTKTILNNKSSVARLTSLQYDYKNNIKNETLDMFTDYYIGNLVVGNINDVKNIDIKISLLPTQQVDTSHVNHNLCGIYDNSLAIIYSGQRGDGKYCTRLCNSLLGLMVIEGYYPLDSTHVGRIGASSEPLYTGLFRRYNISNGRPSKLPKSAFVLQKTSHMSGSDTCSYVNGSTEGNYNCGDNAWVGIAFAKTVLKFGKSLEKKVTRYYVNAALDQFLIVTRLVRTEGMYRGFYSRTDSEKLLTQDHCLIYALCKLLQEINVQFMHFGLKTFMVPVKSAMDICSKFTSQMFNRDDIMNYCNPTPRMTEKPEFGYYFAGTVGSGRINEMDCKSVNADSQTYAFLTGCGSSQVSTDLSMIWTDNTFKIADTDSKLAKGRGCGVESLNLPCRTDIYGADDIYFGYSYSYSDGIQWDSSACALMSIYIYNKKANAKDKEILKGSLSNKINSINKLSEKYAKNGIPLSFRAETAYLENEHPSNSGSQSQPVSFWDYPDTGATMWCALTMNYIKENDPGYNPFSPASTNIIKNSKFEVPDWIDKLTIANRIMCAFDHDTNMYSSDPKYSSDPNCGPCKCRESEELHSDTSRTIQLYCDLFKTSKLSDFKNPSGDQLLRVFDVNDMTQYPMICDSPYFNTCSTQTQAIGIQNLYKKWSIANSCVDCSLYS